MLVRQKKRYLISAFIFLFLLLGTGVGFVLLKNSQDVRQQASTGCKAGEPYCSCDMWGGNCVVVDPEGVRKIVDQGSAENNKGIISTSFTGERPTTGGACGGVWMNEFCYMPGDEIAGGYIVVDSGRYNYPYLEKKTTYESLGFGGETVDNQTGTVASLGEDCGGNSYRIGNNCYAFGAVVNGYLVMPNRTSGCNNSTGDYCYAHLKKIEVPYSDWQNAVDKYEDTGDYSKLEELYKKIYGISFQPGELYDPKASNADVLRAQALISALTSADVLQKNAQAENQALDKKDKLTEEEQAIYDFNKRIIDYPDLAKNYQILDQLNDATSQKITINNAISQMYSDLVVAKDDANLNKLANIKFKEIFGYDPSGKYGNLNGILGAFGIDPTQLDKDRDNYAKAIAEATEKQNEAIAEQNEDVDKLNQEYQEYVNGQSENINDLKKAALDSGVITESEIKNLSEEDLLALLLSKLSETTFAQAKQDAIAIVTARETSVQEQELTQNYLSGQEGEDAKDNLLELYELYVGHAPTYRMTTSELQKEIAKHNSQIALSLYAQTQDVSYLNTYFTSNFPNAPASQLTKVLGDPEALLDSIYGSALGGELYQDIVLPQKFNEAVANFSNDTGASLTSVCKEMGITNCNIDSTNATVTLSLMLDKMYGDNADVNIPDLATSYSNQIYANVQEDETEDFWNMVFANFAAANAAEHAGITFSDDSALAKNLASTTANQQEAMQDYHNAVEATKIFNASQAFQYATENRADLSDYTWGLSYGNALMADNVFNREFTIDELGLNTGQTISLTFNQLTTQIANVDVAQNIATNYATSKYYDYTGPADTKISNIALIGAENLNVLDYDYQEAEEGYYTDKTLKSWGESIGEAMTYLGASYASSQMNQMALNQSFYSDDNNFEFVDPVAYAEQASAEFKATYHEDMVNDLYEEYIAVADIQNVTKLDYEQFLNDPEVQRSSKELNYERLEKVVAPAAAIVVLPAMMLTGVGAPIILGAASSAFSLYQGAGMKAQSLELQRIDIESRENAIMQSYIDSGASTETLTEVRTQLDEQIETLNKQGNLMLANSAVAALTSAGGWATTLANAGQLTGTIGNIALTSGQVLTKMGQLGGIGLNTYNTINSSITAYNAFEQGNTWEGITSATGAFVSASGVAGNTFGVFGPTTFTNKIDYVLDAMNVPAGAGMDLQQVSQACFSGSDAFSEKDCTNSWIGLALSIGQNVSQVSSSYKSYRNDTDITRVTDLQKQLDAIDLEILALSGPNKNISSGLQINDLALQRSILIDQTTKLIDQITSVNPNYKITNANSTEDYLAAGMRISLDLENKAQIAIDAGQDAQAMRLIEQAEMFRNKPVEVSALKDQINAIDEQINSKGLFLSTNELADLQQNRNELVTKLETVVKDLSAIDSMQKQNEIILQTVKADTAFQELNRLLGVDAQKLELVRTYSPSNEAVAKYRTELNPDAETIKLETDADGRLKSLSVLEDSLAKLTDLETQRQMLSTDSESNKEAIAKLDAEIAPLQKIVDGFSTNSRSFFQKITDAVSPNKASREAYYKSLDLTREAEIAKAKLIEAEQNGSATHALKEQLADINRQLVEQKYILAQDLLNPSKNFVQRIAEFIPNLQTNRQIADLKTAAQKLGDANLKIAEQIVAKQATIEKLRTEDATKNQADIDELEKQIVDLSQTARNLLKGNNALMKVDQAGEFTKYIVTEAGEKAGIKQKQLDILNKELENFEIFKRGETGIEKFKIYSNTGSFKDQDIFLLAEVEAFGAGRRGTVFGALPGMGKTDVVMPFNVLLKQRLTNEPQFIVFPEPKLMKPWTSDASYTPNKAFIDYVETNFGKGSVLIVRANDPNVDPLAIARAKFVITTKDVAFDLQNTDTSVGLALRNKWKNSFVHADEVDWTFNPNENYKISGQQVALRDKPEFDLYLNAQKSVLGIDETGNLSGKGLSSLRNLINQLETSKSIPDGIVRTSDGKGGKFADADLEKQVLSEWLGTWGGQSKISDLDMSADISVIREKINTYLNTDTDTQTHNHRAELAMINETVNFLSRVPGEDYGVSSNTRMNGDVEEIINSIAPKEQNRDTGRSYSAVAESLLYNTLGARILGANGQIDLTKLTVGENGSEINYALLMLESRGFSLYTGTPETVAKLYQMAYGIELKVFTDSAVDDSIARFKDSDSELFTDLESQIKARLAENKDQVFINMVSGLRSNEVALNDLVTKISTADANNQTYKKLMLIGASGKLAEYDLVDGNLQYVRDFASTDDLNNRTAELNGSNERYVKFYEYGAHVGVDTKNNVDTSRAIGLCNGCDATTFAQGINRVRVQVETLATGGSVTKSAPMDVVWLDAPAGIKNPNIDDFATAIKDRQTINEALAEVSFKETLLRNSVDSTLADLIDLARNGKKGFLGLGAYRTNQDLVAQLEMAQQKWKETTQMNYMLGSDDLSAQRKLEKTASQVAGAYEELSKLLIGSGEPAKLLTARADGAIGNNKLQLAFSGDDDYKVLGERPSYRQIVELINQSSKHLENVDIAFTNRSSQAEVVQSEIAKAVETQANVSTRNNAENVNQNIFTKTAETISERFNSTNFQKIIRTPVTFISSAYNAIADFFSEEEISPEVLAQRDKVVNDLKITNEDALIALDDLTTKEEIDNFVAERQSAYQTLKDQFNILNTVRPSINNEEDYKTQENKFNEIVTEIEDLQKQSGLNFIEINENGEISRVNEDQFKNLSTFRAKAEIQIEKLAKQTEAEKLLAENKEIVYKEAILSRDSDIYNLTNKIIDLKDSDERKNTLKNILSKYPDALTILEKISDSDLAADNYVEIFIRNWLQSFKGDSFDSSFVYEIASYIGAETGRYRYLANKDKVNASSEKLLTLLRNGADLPLITDGAFHITSLENAVSDLEVGFARPASEFAVEDRKNTISSQEDSEFWRENTDHEDYVFYASSLNGNIRKQTDLYSQEKTPVLFWSNKYSLANLGVEQQAGQPIRAYEGEIRLKGKVDLKSTDYVFIDQTRLNYLKNSSLTEAEKTELANLEKVLNWAQENNIRVYDLALVDALDAIALATIYIAGLTDNTLTDLQMFPRGNFQILNRDGVDYGFSSDIENLERYLKKLPSKNLQNSQEESESIQKSNLISIEEQATKDRLALEEAEKLKQAEERAALELAQAKEAEEKAKASITTVLYSIGRNENNSLQTIPGIATVSRNHAQIIQDGNNNLYIRDLNSTNGTYVNNQRITAENNVLLKEGDAVFLGNPNSIGVSFKVTKDSNNQLSLKPADVSHIVDNSAVGKAKQAINNVAKSTADALINRFNFKATVANYNASAKSAAQNLANQVGKAIASRLENILQPADQNLAEDEGNANVISQNTILPKLNQQNLIDVQNKINNVGDVRGSFNELLWTHNTPFSSLAAIFQSGGISSLSAEGRAYIQAENITEEEFWKRFNQQQDLRTYGKYVKRGFNARYGLSSDFGDIKFVFKPGFEQNKKGYDENLGMITDEPFISDFFNLNGTLFKNKYTSPRNNAEFNLSGFLRGIAQSYGFNKHLSTDLTEGYNPGLGVLERPYVNPQMQVAGAVTLDDVQAILVPAHLYDEAIKMAKNSGFDLNKIIKVNTGNKENYYAYDRSDIRKSSTAIRDQAIADGVMRPNRIGRISGSSVTMVTAKEAFEKEQQAYLQIMLDLELSKTTQSNSLSNEFLFNLMIEGLKKQTVKIGSQSFSVKQLFEESAGVWEKYSVEESTEMVYRQFNKYFAPNLNNEQKEFFTLLISLHDLGKSMERAQRLPEHSVTITIAKQILQKLNYSAQEINKFIALIEQDFLGDYFKNTASLDETYKKIKAQAEKYNLDPKDYLSSVYIFYMSDAGSYTKDAGGFISLEGRVFNQNALNNGQLLLNDVNVAKFKQLEKLINSNKVAFNSLCSDCDQVRLTTQAGVEKADVLARESEALLQQAEEAKNNNDTNKAQDLSTQAEAKKQEALKQLNDTRFQIVNSHGMQNQCVQLYLNAWVDTREALIRKTRADIDNAIDSVYKATVLAEEMMDSKQIEIRTNTVFGLGGEIVYQPLSDEEVDEIGDLLFGNEAKNIEGLQSWATFDLDKDGKFNRTVLKGSLLNLDNTVVTSQVSPIRVFLRKFAVSSRQMMLLDNLKTTLSSYLNEEAEDQADISVTPIISITVSPTPSSTPTPEPISPTPSIAPASPTTQDNVNWHLILNIIGTTLGLTLFGSILGHLPIFAAPELPEETPTAIVEEVKKEESVLAPEPTSTPTPSPVITSTPIPTIDEAVEMKIEEEEKEEVVFFNQLDDRWKNIQIDKNTRFGNVGCGPVSVANLTGISPEQVLKFYETGSAMGITAKGTGIEANEAALQKLGYETSTGVNGNGVLEDEIRRANSRNDYREVINELNNYQENGDWKIMLNGNFGNLDGGGHWVVVTEVNTDANTITVIDPNGGELKEYVLDISGNSGNDNAITPKKLLLAKKA